MIINFLFFTKIEIFPCSVLTISSKNLGIHLFCRQHYMLFDMQALSNGRYKSCLHRAVVNKDSVRKSLAYFVSPKEDKVVRPPQDLMEMEKSRKYPDFTWSSFLEFTQKHYRADVTTLQSFIDWLLSTNKNPKYQFLGCF